MVKKSNLFLDTTENKIDAKARVSIPADFRNVLEALNTELVLYPSFKAPCIEGMTGAMLEKLSASIQENFDFFSDAQEDLSGLIFAESKVFIPDSTGRISLSAKLITHAELSETALFVGKGQTFQIWNPALFEKAQAVLRQKMKNHPLTLPLQKGGKE